jgi:hypothetical protein
VAGTRAKKSDPRLLTGKQIQAIGLLAQGETSDLEIMKTVGINDKTWRTWRKNPEFINKVYDLQSSLTKESLERAKVKMTKRPKKALVKPDIHAKALKDFDFFRREFLGRKRVACQVRWARYFDLEDRSVLLCPRNHGKSTTIIDYVVWRIVRDRTVRILILSKSSNLAARWVRSIKSILEGRGEYEKITQYFGDFKPQGKPDKWTQEELIVEGARPEEPHPTLSCYGITAAIYGLRADLILCDDIVDRDNAATEDQREKLRDTFFSGIENILDSANGLTPKMMVVGTRKHPLDLYNDLIQTEGFEVHIENAVRDWRKGRILAPELFSIQFFRDKLAKLKLKKFNREFQNAAFDERDVIVASDAFDNGQNFDYARSYGDRFSGWYVTIAVDPGISMKGKGSFSASVVGFNPEEPGRRYLIDYFEGAMPSEDQPRFLCSWYIKYKANAMRIESNACQKYLMDSVRREATLGGAFGGQVWHSFFPVINPHMTTRTKLNHPDVGLETVGHYFELGLWSLPAHTDADEAQTQELTEKVTGYTYAEHRRAHLLMTLWFAENEILSRQAKTLDVQLLDVPDYRDSHRRWIEVRRG